MISCFFIRLFFNAIEEVVVYILKYSGNIRKGNIFEIDIAIQTNFNRNEDNNQYI